jgi:hypothetical protein
MNWNYDTTHERKSPIGNKATTWWHISILTACLALFLLAAGTLGYIGFITEYCWYRPDELNSCESYQTATAVIHGASWLVKPVTALATIVSAIQYSRFLFIRRPDEPHDYYSRSSEAADAGTCFEEPSTTKRSPSYDEAVQTAALMFLASLRDYIESPFSGSQLELLRNRIDIVRNRNCVRLDNVHAVFADVRERAAALLSEELLAANVGDQVAAEVIRVLHHLLTAAEDTFSNRRTDVSIRL